MSTNPSLGRVFLVGAGPGDPSLLTLRAVECLRQADLVIFDRLVDPRALEFAPAAEKVCVNDLAGTHPERQPHVQDRLLAAARAGHTVVRLKGGDPLVFGRGAEEAAALRDAGIPFEIVPGVTAALAAGACAGIPLTHRDFSSAVAFVTGHECPGKSEAAIDWAALAHFPGTLVIYMGLARLAEIAKTLMEHSKSPTTPVASVQQAGSNRQLTVAGTLADIADKVREAHLSAPVVTIIGPVVALRETLDWFEQRPLFGRRVLVTRPRHQAAGIQRQLETLGATVYGLPVLDIGPAPDVAAVDRLLGRLAEFQWLVFTSVNGVESFLNRLEATGRDWRALGGIRLAAIGPRTAEALQARHLRPDVVPPSYCSESLAESLTPLVRGQRILLARADRGRELLREELAKVAQVEEVAVYSQIDRVEAEPEILDLLRQGSIDFVTLTSSNIARSLVRLLEEDARARLGQETQIITLSPVTSAAVRELGLTVAGEAAEATTEGLVAALVACAAQRSSRKVSIHR